MKGSYGKLCFTVKERGSLEGLYGEGHEQRKCFGSQCGRRCGRRSVVCNSKKDVLQALNEIKTGKTSGPSEVYLILIVTSRGAGCGS